MTVICWQKNKKIYSIHKSVFILNVLTSFYSQSFCLVFQDISAVFAAFLLQWLSIKWKKGTTWPFKLNSQMENFKWLKHRNKLYSVAQINLKKKGGANDVRMSLKQNCLYFHCQGSVNKLQTTFCLQSNELMTSWVRCFAERY